MVRIRKESVEVLSLHYTDTKLNIIEPLLQ